MMFLGKPTSAVLRSILLATFIVSTVQKMAGNDEAVLSRHLGSEIDNMAVSEGAHVGDWLNVSSSSDLAKETARFESANQLQVGEDPNHLNYSVQWVQSAAIATPLLNTPYPLYANIIVMNFFFWYNTC